MAKEKDFFREKNEEQVRDLWILSKIIVNIKYLASLIRTKLKLNRKITSFYGEKGYKFERKKEKREENYIYYSFLVEF